MIVATPILVVVTAAIFYFLAGEVYRRYWHLDKAKCQATYDQLSRRRDLSLITQGGLSGEEHQSAQVRIDRLEDKLKHLKRRLDSFEPKL